MAALTSDLVAGSIHEAMVHESGAYARVRAGGRIGIYTLYRALSDFEVLSPLEQLALEAEENDTAI